MFTVPAGSLVLLVGPSGAGKSTLTDTWVAQGLPDHTIISSDAVRYTLFGTDEIQKHHDLVFQIVHTTVLGRLSEGNTTVVDATNLKPDDIAPLLAMADEAGAATVAVRFPVDLETLRARNAGRDVPRPDKALVRHTTWMEQYGSVKALTGLFDHVVAYDQPVAFAPYGRTVRQLVDDRPLAVIGDVHGEGSKFADLVTQIRREHPDATIVTVGDTGDRGSDSVGAYQTLFDVLASGGHVVASNHGAALADKAGKLLDKGHTAAETADILTDRADDAAAAGKRQPMTEFIAATVAQLAAHPDGDALLARAVEVERTAPHQLLAHDGRTLVVHGGVRPDLVGRHSAEARQVALFGTPSGFTDDGMPRERDSWVAAYDADERDLPLVVYGHIAYDAPQVSVRTVGIDTGAGKDPNAPVTAAIVEHGQLVKLLP
jgi:predicted kinase